MLYRQIVQYFYAGLIVGAALALFNSQGMKSLIKLKVLFVIFKGEFFLRNLRHFIVCAVGQLKTGTK